MKMGDDTQNNELFIKDIINQNNVTVFSKTTCPFCKKVKVLFDNLKIPYFALELDQLGDRGPVLQDVLQQLSGQRTVPNVFIQGHQVGGCDKTLSAHADGRLFDMLEGNFITYDYDLIVIGGGSGGLAASKEAAKFGKKVAVCDFVKPSPQGTTWGLGGTCVNVGCIPKKLMHRAALLGDELEESKFFGWPEPKKEHNWPTMVENVQNYIRSLNFNYKKVLKSKAVNYINAYATFIDSHTIEVVDKKGVSQIITAQNFLLAMGCRPSYPGMPGEQYCITSDDIFSLPTFPGKSLLIGASYIALETAGFLHGIGAESTIMVRSILLRGFDQEIANMIGDDLSKRGVRMLRQCKPVSVELLEDKRLLVTALFENGDKFSEEFNTVILAVGRNPCTGGIGLEKCGVTLDKSGRVLVNDKDQSTVRNIFAVGDIIEEKLQLTPVAIRQGKLLAQRLYGNKTTVMDYNFVPTTVFTPLEYGTAGLAEEAAKETFGEADIEVYHVHFQPLEWALSEAHYNVCFAKLICRKSKNEEIVGFHILCPNAGEITQGFSLGLKLGATKNDFDSLIGIHPTNAEIFTTMTITKASGQSSTTSGC